jgi:hypothetical protein
VQFVLHGGKQAFTCQDAYGFAGRTANSVVIHSDMPDMPVLRAREYWR